MGKKLREVGKQTADSGEERAFFNDGHRKIDDNTITTSTTTTATTSNTTNNLIC